MIKGINTGGRYLQVQGGMPSSTYVNNYSGAAGVGNMRYNPSNNNVEVYDGNNWQQLQTSYATVQMTPDAESLLDWARQERDKQWRRESLIKSNPALKKAWEAIKRAEDNFDLLEKFVENDSNAESEQVQASP
jgi:hypothetical protein